MPHFVLDCSAEILHSHSKSEIAHQVHDVVVASGLFELSDIKIRVNDYEDYLVGGKRTAFIHVFASVLEGRTIEQRAALSRSVIDRLTAMFPAVPNIAMNVSEFERATYFNRSML